MLISDVVTTFHDCGYVVLDRVLPEHKIEAVLDDFRNIARRLVEQHFDPVAAKNMRGWSLGKLIVALTRHTGNSVGQHFDISLPPNESAISAETPINTSAAVFEIIADAKLLDVLETIIGGEIWSNPTQHVRLKLPESELPNSNDGLMGRVPWHQDNGVLIPEADESHIVTVWAPLRRATAVNGCLQVIPQSHVTGLHEHCLQIGGYGVPSKEVAKVGAPQTLEMDAGSILLMHQRTLHRALPNKSDEIRFSLDLRYQPTGEPSGRPQFPGFVVRSRSGRYGVIDSPTTWAARWSETRRRLSSANAIDRFFRWTPGGELCA
jgi:ectoine hydroxylase-related dioxygenase (phytanoyl-CoA dioxygenase family)